MSQNSSWLDLSNQSNPLQWILSWHQWIFINFIINVGTFKALLALPVFSIVNIPFLYQFPGYHLPFTNLALYYKYNAHATRGSDQSYVLSHIIIIISLGAITVQYTGIVPVTEWLTHLVLHLPLYQLQEYAWFDYLLISGSLGVALESGLSICLSAIFWYITSMRTQCEHHFFTPHTRQTVGREPMCNINFEPSFSPISVQFPPSAYAACILLIFKDPMQTSTALYNVTPFSNSWIHHCMSAVEGSVHLLYSMSWKLGQKRGSRTHQHAKKFDWLHWLFDPALMW